MSHSKWAKTEIKKAASDAKKSKIFTKMVKLIMAEVKIAGGNVDSPGVRTAIEKARSVDMPKDNIERALKKATEGKDNLETIIYEGYGPGGVGIVIEALTDNRNRATQEIKYILSKHGGVLGAMGSVMWNFIKENGSYVPQTYTPISSSDGEILSKILEELEDNDDVQNVYTNGE